MPPPTGIGIPPRPLPPDPLGNDSPRRSMTPPLLRRSFRHFIGSHLFEEFGRLPSSGHHHPIPSASFRRRAPLVRLRGRGHGYTVEDTGGATRPIFEPEGMGGAPRRSPRGAEPRRSTARPPIGYIVVGLVVGMLARLLVPGRDAVGLLGTFVIGIDRRRPGWLACGRLPQGDGRCGLARLDRRCHAARSCSCARAPDAAPGGSRSPRSSRDRRYPLSDGAGEDPDVRGDRYQARVRRSDRVAGMVSGRAATRTRPRGALRLPDPVRQDPPWNEGRLRAAGPSGFVRRGRTSEG